MADFRLNTQIKRQCQAFRRGFFDLIDQSWLVMFAPRELQTLLSGSDRPIDLKDMKQHTVYGGVYHADHPTIKMFWSAVESLTDDQLRDLLKFVTSCRLPPLLGFGYLNPKFAVSAGGDEEMRLPTAATCMNLLKLPQYSDEATLRAKLLMSITSNSGFELS